jgi:hypothetical protein
VLAQKWDELFCVFVGEVHSGAVNRVDGNRRCDEVGEPMRPFGFASNPGRLSQWRVSVVASQVEHVPITVV